MIAEKRSAILVRGPGGQGIAGIVTDVDLRNKVVVGGVSRHAPVTEIMSAPVHTIGAEVLAPEASIAMMAAGVNHMPVLDADGEVVGILSASSLMTLEARSPFALRREIMAARNEEEVVAAAADIPKLFVDLMTAHMDAPSVTRVLTVLHDSLTARLLELAIDRLGEPPVPYAWLAFGSAARSELTLASDQDNGLAFDDTDDPAVEDYFRVLAQRRQRRARALRAACDPHGVLARQPRVAHDAVAVEGGFEDCLDGQGPRPHGARQRRLRLPPDRRRALRRQGAHRRAPPGAGAQALPERARQAGHQGAGRRSASAASSRAASTSRRTGSCPSRTSPATTPSPPASRAASTLERLTAVVDVVGESVESRARAARGVHQHAAPAAPPSRQPHAQRPSRWTT